MSLRRTSVLALVLVLLGGTAASAGPRPVQIPDRENDTEQLVETIARSHEGTVDIVFAGVREAARHDVSDPTAPTRDLRVDLQLAGYVARAKGLVYRVSAAVPGLCGREDNRLTVETVMTELGARSHLTTRCASEPIPLQAEIGQSRISWYVPASALPVAVVRGTRLLELRADTGWVQHYFDHAGLVRGYGAYEQGDEAVSRSSFVLR